MLGNYHLYKQGNEKTMMEKIDKEEDRLINKFESHSVFHRIESISQDKFIEILCQRRFLSLILTVVYDIAIDALSDEKSIQVARQILREEYPDMDGNKPSHREDLIADLIALGTTKRKIIETRPTPETQNTIQETFDVIYTYIYDEKFCDIKILSMLRFWGEILVSVEYGQFWKRIKKQLAPIGDNKSRFYYPHYNHDGRTKMVEASPASPNHSGRLGWRLSPHSVHKKRTKKIRKVIMTKDNTDK